ncbi:MAG TPA: AMP-binding protein, partial [Pirellulales bacterium]
GLIGGILQPLYMGRLNTLLSPTHFLQRPVRWLQAISQSGSTISGGPNFAYDLCAEKVTAEQKRTLDLSRWSLAFNGAEPVRAETIDRFSKAFAECGFRREAFYPCYGLAEATLIVAGGYKQSEPVVQSFDLHALEKHEVVPAAAGAEHARELVGSGGNLLDQNIVIADPETFEPCTANQVGEIWVSGPSVAQGYWRREEATHETFQARLRDGRGPFLRTGDLGFLHKGELFVTGRLKDLIIIHGVNYYPQDIEQSIGLAHDKIKLGAGAAFAVGDQGAERLVVVQETERGRHLNFEEIITAIRKRVANEMELAVSAIVLLKTGSIPKTSSGKIQRHACQAGYLAGTLAAVATWSAETGQVEVVQSARRRGADLDDAVDDGIDYDADGLEAAADLPEKLAAAPAALNGAARKPAAPAAKGADPRLTGNRPQIIEVVYAKVREIGRERVGELDWDTNIVELGLDSLERMEIVASLEEAFGGRFPDSILPSMETCGEVVEAIEQFMGGELKVRTGAPAAYEVAEEDYQFAKSAEYLRLQENFKLTTQHGMT